MIRWAAGAQAAHLLTAQVKIVNIYFYLNIVLTFWPPPHKTPIFNHLEHKSLPQSRLGGGHPSGYLEEEFCSLLPSIFRDRPQEPLTVLHFCFEKRRPSWKTMGPVLNAVQTINWWKKPWRKKLVSQMGFFVPSLTSLKEGVCCFWRVGFFQMEEQFSNSQRVFHSPIHHEYVRQVFQLLFIQYKAIFLITDNSLENIPLVLWLTLFGTKEWLDQSIILLLVWTLKSFLTSFGEVSFHLAAWTPWPTVQSSHRGVAWGIPVPSICWDEHLIAIFVLWWKFYYLYLI